MNKAVKILLAIGAVITLVCVLLLHFFQEEQPEVKVKPGKFGEGKNPFERGSAPYANWERKRKDKAMRKAMDDVVEEAEIILNDESDAKEKSTDQARESEPVNES